MSRHVIRPAVLVGLLVLGSMPYLAADDFPELYNSDSDRNAEPMDAERAAEMMQLPEGFHATVFASEPDVQNPIAMTWDDHGRMWVAENYTYAERGQRFDLSLRDRVVILEDTDQDGVADSRSVFTDQVQMLTSIEVGRGGLWLMCPPQLLFIPDADQDGKPDGPAQVVLDGFHVAQDNYHNFANGLKWGPDGWLYGRCGGSCPASLGLVGTPDESRIPMHGGIWRYHPRRKVVEVICHGTVNPWGHDWDQDGELFFINTVIGHLWHAIPGAHFKEMFGESNHPAVYERLDMIADHYHFDTRGSWTDSRDGKANDFGGGHAHIGMMIYQAERWPQQYQGKLFTLNQHGRRANVERLQRQGAGYVAKHDPDFFLAADPFFRGIEISVGPDGNVYVADWSDTGECHEHTGVHRTSGRIYKIAYGDDKQPPSLPMPKPWCIGGSGTLPQLWRDYQAGHTDTKQLLSLLSDSDEHVRGWAIRLLTDSWPIDTEIGPQPNATYPDAPQVREAFTDLAKRDSSSFVHLVLASTLQRLPVEHRAALAIQLVRNQQHAEDRDLPSLVWYGLAPVGDHDPMALVEVAKACRFPDTTRWIARNLAARIETAPQPLAELLAVGTELSTPLQHSILDGISEALRGWRRAPKPDGWERFTSTAAAKQNPDLTRQLSSLFGDGRAMQEIRQLALSDSASLSVRKAALRTLIDARPDDLRKVCESLIGSRGINAVAADGLALYDDPAIGELLSRNYRRFHHEDRPSVLEILVSRPSFARALLDQVDHERGQIRAGDISAFHARQIRGLGDEKLSQRLGEVWGVLRDSPADRRERIESLRAELTKTVLADADLSSGRALFKKTCAQCHTLYGDGEKIGPDLTGSQRSNLDYLLENMLDPSAVVGKDYHMSIVLTVDRRVLNGLIVSQDERTLVLQTQTKQESIPQSEIEAIKDTTLSPMPDGLLDSLTPQQTRDLFAYLMHPSQVPLP